jgi:type II secretory pathway component PulF
MIAFRYQAIEAGGAPVKGVIEAPDRRSALQLLGERGLFPSQLEACAAAPTHGQAAAAAVSASSRSSRTSRSSHASGSSRSNGAAEKTVAAAGSSSLPVSAWGSRLRRKDITAFTRERSALLGAAIPIPQALDGLAAEEANPALKSVLTQISTDVRTGLSLSAAMARHRHFNSLYVSMVRVGEEAGVLPRVMNDLADLLEHEDEVRGEVVSAVAYPAFVLAFGIATVTVLLTVVLPRLFGMLQEMLNALPLPTLILLRTSEFIVRFWPGLLFGLLGALLALRWFSRTPQGAFWIDGIKLKLPVAGSVFHAAALGRFARTLGTLVKSGVSLLPALKIVESTVGNLVLAQSIARVSEETRGGDSLAAPLRKLGLFPHTVIQMIHVGEESGKLDDMLLKVADIEERHMRARIKTLISLLAPALILVVGALVGFMVIALLLPIFRMSRSIH